MVGLFSKTSAGNNIKFHKLSTEDGFLPLDTLILSLGKASLVIQQRAAFYDAKKLLDLNSSLVVLLTSTAFLY